MNIFIQGLLRRLEAETFPNSYSATTTNQHCPDEQQQSLMKTLPTSSRTASSSSAMSSTSLESSSFLGASSLPLGASSSTSVSASTIVRADRKYPNYRDPLNIYYKSLENVMYLKCRTDNNRFYYCLDCKQQMKTFNAICNHINKHRNVSPYKCNLCYRQYTTLRSLKFHFKTKHYGKNFGQEMHYKCPICLQLFMDFQTLHTHIIAEISSYYLISISRNNATGSHK